MNLYFGYLAGDNNAKMKNAKLDCSDDGREHRDFFDGWKIILDYGRRGKDIEDFSFRQWKYLQKIIDFEDD